jgi:hypothetical protein
VDNQCREFLNLKGGGGDLTGRHFDVWNRGIVDRLTPLDAQKGGGARCVEGRK